MEFFVTMGVFLGLVVYFVPTIIAFRKDHHSRVAIFVLNWFAFTFVLWIVALVWALSNPPKVEIVHSNNRNFDQ